MIEYSKVEKALYNLKQQFGNWRTLDSALPQLTAEAVAESVIQRFEICYDCLWKVLKRYLVEELGLPDPPNSPKPLFRLAGENNLLPSGVEQWMLYANTRIDTSHDYSGEKAQAGLSLMEVFIKDTEALIRTLIGKLPS